MFINDVMSEVWKSFAYEYEKVYINANAMSKDTLYQSIKKDIEENCKSIRYGQGETALSTLVTSGCPHCNKNGKFSGCSMCNFIGSYYGIAAKMAALKSKDVNLYAKAVRYSFEIQRGEEPEPYTFELVSAFDCLNNDEFPDEVFDELFVKKGLYKRKPYKYIIETRASSVKLEKLEKWQKILGRRVIVELGVEVGDEWIRNHWLNKDITNNEIIKAITLIKSIGWECSANVLIGFPGFTDEQSVVLFNESVKWLDEIGADHIIYSPIIVKERTLQHLIHCSLLNNEKLMDKGINKINYMGGPNIFTIIECIYNILNENPNLLKKLVLSGANFPTYWDAAEKYYKDTQLMEQIHIIKNALYEFDRNKDIKILSSCINNVKQSESYKYYGDLKLKEKKAGLLKDTILLLAEEISKEIWKDNWKTKLDEFNNEFSTFRSELQLVY